MIRFPAVGEPKAIGDGEPAWGGKFPIDPKSPYVKQIEDAMLAEAKALWKDDGKSVLEMLKEDKKVCFERKPYKSKKNGEVYNGFEGKFTLGTRTSVNKAQPTVFKDSVDPLTDEKIIVPVEGNAARERLIYDGCIVDAKVEVWTQQNKFGRRINCSLLGVKFVGDGEHFGGGSGPASADDFSVADAGDVL